MNNMVVVSSIGAIGMAMLAMFVRMKAAKKPATAKKNHTTSIIYEYRGTNVCGSDVSSDIFRIV